MKTLSLIAGLALALSMNAHADGDGHLLSCGSQSVNINVELNGNQADITLNDILRVYVCKGSVSTAGASLNCTTTADDAPKTFGLHVGPNGKGTFSFSGNTGTPDLECSIHGI